MGVYQRTLNLTALKRMQADKAFLDTNILLYLLSVDETKAMQAENTIVDGNIISVQVLNEFASVSRRKLKMPFAFRNQNTQFQGWICKNNSLSGHQQPYYI